MPNTTKLRSLIEEYGRLRNRQGFTPQGRGQRFNSFIAELFSCWGIPANANMLGEGEIDVAFNWEGHRFIVEAKWENKRIGTGPISILKEKLQQRLKNTFGLFLSMSGFTPKAVSQLGRGGPLTVLLLDHTHLEAMLSGFISPQEMLDLLLDKAARYGSGYNSIESSFPTPAASILVPSKDGLQDIWNKPIVVKSEPGFEAEVVAADLPIFQTKIAEYKKDQILFTHPGGIYLLDIARKKVEPFLAVPDSKDIWVTHNQQVYIARNMAVARYTPETDIQIVGGGFSNGNITNKVFLLGNGDDVWVVADENEYVPSIQLRDDWMYTPPTPPAPTSTKLGEKLGDEQRYSTNLFGGRINNAALVGDNQFLALSEAWGDQFLLTPLEGPTQPMWYGLRNEHPQPKAALHLPNGQLLAALAGVQELRHLAPRATFRSRSYGIE